MHGIVLVYVFVAAMLGALVLGLGGAYDAMQSGEKWSWPKYGKTVIAAIGAGVTAAGVAAGSGGTLDLWATLLFAFAWGMGIQGGTNTLFSLCKGTPPTTPTG